MNQPSIHIAFSPEDQSAALALWRALSDLGCHAELGLEQTGLSGEVRAPLLSTGVTHLVLLASPSSVQSLFVSRTIEEFLKSHKAQNILPVWVTSPQTDNDQNAFLNAVYLYERSRTDSLLHPRAGLNSALGSLDADRPESIARKIATHIDAAPRSAWGLETLLAPFLVSPAGWGTAALASVAAITFGVWGYSQQQAADEAALEAHLSRQASRQMLANLNVSLSSDARHEVFSRLGEDVLGLTEADMRLSDPEDLSRQAAILHVVGEAREQEGDLNGAVMAYRQAADITAHLLAQSPEDPTRIYDHAQSVFWIGDVALGAGDFDTAEVYFERYAGLADQLVGIDASNPVYRGEWAYAQSNLGAVSMGRNEGEEALAYLDNAIAGYQDGPIEAGIVSIRSLANAYGWRAGPLRALGRIEEAIASRTRQLEIAETLILEDPDNRSHRTTLVSTTLARADMFLDLGELDQAEQDIEAISPVIGALYAELPESRLIRRKYLETELLRARIAFYRGELNRSQLIHSAASRAYTSGQGVESEDGRRIDLGVLELLRTEIALQSNAYEAALTSALQAATHFEADLTQEGSRLRHFAAFARFYAGEALQAMGRPGEAEREWRSALSELAQFEPPRDLRADDVYARVQYRLGETSHARALYQSLLDRGYARPDFIAFWDAPDPLVNVRNSGSQEAEDG